MKHDWIGVSMGPQEELIAMFGGAQIIKNHKGHLQIRGGTDAEQAQAHAWMKQFFTPHLHFGPWSHYLT